MVRTMELRVPKLGDFSGVPVVEIFMVAGTPLAKNDPMVSLESEKAVIEVPAPESGRILTVSVVRGDKVSEGDLLGTLELEVEAPEKAAVTEKVAASEESSTAEEIPASEEAGPASASPMPMATESAPLPAPADRMGRTAESAPEPETAPSSSGPGLYHASPSVRLFARELGADLAFVRGTGPKGRIRREDVAVYVAARLAALQSGLPSGTGGDAAYVLRKSSPVDPESFRKYGEIEIVPASRIKRLSGPRLAESWQTIPHVTQFDEVDITELEAFRSRSIRHLEAEGIKLTALAFAIKASVATLKAFPLFNSTLLPEKGEFAVKKYYNIGFAVSTEAGLLVPSIKGADKKSLREIGAELKELSAKAAAGKLTPDDMTGSTFTISSLGSIGGTAFTPIINPPEVAILGLSRATMRPVWDEKSGGFLPRLVLPFSLSYDHRAIDGAEGARFCRHFAALMGDPAALLI